MGAAGRKGSRPNNPAGQDTNSSTTGSPAQKKRNVLDPNTGALLRRAPVAMLICDKNGKITFANALARKMGQLSPIGRSLNAAPGIWGEMFDERGRYMPASEWPCATALRGEITNARECHLVRWDRSSRYVLMSASPICTSGSQVTGAMTTLIDISEHKRREIARRGEAIWKERSRMAAEIHDSLSQGLNAIVLQLDAVKHHLKGDVSQAQRRVGIALDQARHNLAEARRSMWILSHPNFEGEEPGSAITFLAQQLFKGSSIQVELSVDDEPYPLFSRLRRELVQIAKEAMINTLKHADAAKVRIELSYDFQTVRLSVSDDGRGFVRASISDSGHGYGLFSMRSRAENLGGKFLIDVQLGKGTRISVIVPFSRSMNRICA